MIIPLIIIIIIVMTITKRFTKIKNKSCIKFAQTKNNVSLGSLFQISEVKAHYVHIYCFPSLVGSIVTVMVRYPFIYISSQIMEKIMECLRVLKIYFIYVATFQFQNVWLKKKKKMQPLSLFKKCARYLHNNTKKTKTALIDKFFPGQRC